MKNLLIGIGNILFSDEAIGCYVASYLDANYRFDDLDIVEAGTPGFKLLDYFYEYDHLYIIDTISIDDEPGTLYCIPSEELMGLQGYKKTAHEVEVLEMLQTSQLMEHPPAVTVLGIVPYDIETVHLGLSDPLDQRFEALVLQVLSILESEGIAGERSAEPISKERIIERFRSFSHEERA